VFSNRFRRCLVHRPVEDRRVVTSRRGHPERRVDDRPIRNSNTPPQPFLVGAAKELFTSEFLLTAMIVPSGLKASVSGLPEIDLFGAGGLVLPVVSVSTIGAAFDPT
jgi:hypothetical protein